MGFWAKVKENQERAKQRAFYGVHSVDGGVYKYLPEGKFKSATKPIAGARAEFDTGRSEKRMTLTRVGAGAILFGPLGAIAGGMLKKDKTKNYIVVEFSDGDAVIIDGPAKDEAKMRQFALDVNRIAAMQQ